MTWFKVDDAFWGHPKQTALPPGPVALWVRAGSWSSDQLTDGLVPAHMVTMLGAKKRDAEQLVTAGLWESVPEGYQFHDWQAWQPSREEVHAKRAEEAERKRKWREKRAADKAAAQAAVPDVSQWDNSVASGGTDAGVPDLSRSSRTRPDPTRPVVSYGDDGHLQDFSRGGYGSRREAEHPPSLPGSLRRARTRRGATQVRRLPEAEAGEQGPRRDAARLPTARRPRPVRRVRRAVDRNPERARQVPPLLPEGDERMSAACTCDRQSATYTANPEGHRSGCPARPGADYYRAKLRSILASRNGAPGIVCLYCGAEPGEWCEFDCGSPFPVLHPEYRDKTPLDRVRALALSEQRNGGLLDPADVLAALDASAS